MKVLHVLKDHLGAWPHDAKVDDNHISITMLREPMTRADWTTHDYNVHFCVGVENQGSRVADVEVSVEGGRWDDLPEITPLLYVSENPNGPFVPANLSSRTDLGKRYVIRVPLDRGQKIYIANTLFRDPEAFLPELDTIARKGGAERRVIGRSGEGRDLIAYIYGDPGAQPCVLVTSGFHPPEPDTLASEAIMKWLASSDGQALLRDVAVAVVPAVNPDGFARGAQGANAAGINMYWGFYHEDDKTCPECVALWSLAGTMRPRVYIDFHAYSFQLKKEPGPYVRPLSFYRDEKVREAAGRIYNRLLNEVGGKAVRGFPSYAPTTFGSLLTARYDTVSVAKYHVHLKEGAGAIEGRGLAVFRVAAEELVRSGLARPEGTRPAELRDVRDNLRTLWAGLLRPVLGNVRRGRVSAVRFDRNGLDIPADGLSDELRKGTSE